MKFLTLLILSLVLFSCGGVTTPETHYYRLSPVDKNKVNPIDLKKNIFTVSDFKTTGMLNNRNLLYIEGNKPNEIKQFYYHQWHDSLDAILTKHFIDYLKLAVNKSGVSSYDYKGIKGRLIRPELQKMEITYSSGSTIISMDIAFKVQDDTGEIILDKIYSASRSSNTKDIYQLTINYNDLLLEIYNNLITDL